MPTLSPNLNAELLTEYEEEARLCFADLLSSLSSATHVPTAVSDPGRDPLVAVAKLRDCWVEATMMAVPRASLTARLPLPVPDAFGLLDNLLALAAYSGAGVERVQAAGRLLHHLSEAAHSYEPVANEAEVDPIDLKGDPGSESDKLEIFHEVYNHSQTAN